MKRLMLLQQWPLFLSSILLPIIIIFFFFFLLKNLKKKATTNFPPSPWRLPIIGNLHQLGSLPHQSLKVLSDKYGPIILLHFGYVPTIVISSAKIAHDVMKKHDLVFASRPRSSMAERLMYDSDISFSPYGEYWRQVRKISAVHMLSTIRVQSFCSVREDEVMTFTDKVRKNSCKGLVNLSELIFELTNNVVCRVAFGRKYTGEEGGKYKFREMLEEFVTLLGIPPTGELVPWLSWVDTVTGLDSRVRKCSQELDGFLESVLEEHLHGKATGGGDYEPNNFVDVLLSLDHNDDMVGFSLQRDNIKAIILDMFAAGTHTTATVIEWAMAELIKNPKEMMKVQKEITEVIAYKENIMEEDIDKMHYLKATVKEALRLHAPLPLLVPRETTEHINIKGYDIPAGTKVIVNAWAIGRDPKSWDKPEEFCPDRFINSNVDFRGQDFELIPFGAGRRACPGLHFSTATIQLTLAHLLHYFGWELPEDMEDEVLDMSEMNGISVSKKSKLILVAKPLKA